MAEKDAKNPDGDGQQADARLDGDFTDAADLDDEELAEIENALRRAAREHRIDLGQQTPGQDGEFEAKTMNQSPASDDDLEAQIAEAEARLKTALSDGEELVPDFEAQVPELSREDPIDPELRERVEKFGRKVDEIGARRESQQRAKKTRAELDSDAARGLGVGMMVAYLIIGVPLIGALIGYFVDRATKSGNGTAIGVVAGAILGVAMAISVMNRANRE